MLIEMLMCCVVASTAPFFARFPGYQSYADPANFNDDSGSDSVSTVETSSQTQSANGQQPSQKGSQS